MFGVFATYTLKNPSISQDGPPQPSDISDEMICIYDDRSPDTTLKLINPKLTLADNSAGSFTFSITPDSAIFGKLIRMRTEITVVRNGLEIWSGRIVSEESDFYGNHAFECEGELAYLNDILQPPSAYDDVTIDQFLGSVLANYNAKADSHRQFALGIVSENWMIHPGDFGYYQDVNTTANMSNTWEVIKNTLLDVYGGHLRIRKDGGVRYLDYLNDYPNLSEQIIDFGVNLLDFTRNWDETELATVIYPRGKKLEDEVENDGITGKITKTRHKSNNQYDVEFNLTWINHGVPRDGSYDYEIVMVLYDPRYPADERFAPAFAHSDIWTLEPGATNNQSWTYLIRDFEPDLKYRYEAWVESKQNGTDAPNYDWLPEPYMCARQINHGVGAHTIRTDDEYGNPVIEGTYDVSYNALGGNIYNVDFDVDLKNLTAPTDSYYIYRLEFTIDDPVNGKITKYGNEVTADPGDPVFFTNYCSFTGLDNNRTYSINVYVNYKRTTSDGVWRQLGNTSWDWLPEPYQCYRTLYHAAMAVPILVDDEHGNHVIEGTYTNVYASTSAQTHETRFDITFHNTWTPPSSTTDYEYQIEVTLVDPDRGNLYGYGATKIVKAGQHDDVTGTCSFAGIDSNKSYGFYIYVQYRVKNIYHIVHEFDVHFTDGELDGIEKRVSVRTVNDNLDYVENADTVATYGRLEKVVTWDYIEDPAKLLSLARWYLSDYQFNNVVLSVNALDLSYLDVDYDRIKLLDRVKAVSRPHGMNHEFPVTKLDVPLDHPENTTFTLGDKSRDSYTASVGNDTNDIYDQIGAFPTSGDILKEIGSAGYKILQRAKENAKMILDSRTNGTITIVEGDDGYSDAIYFTETKDYTQATRFWRWNMNGLGFFDGNDVKIGITSDGKINADMITTGELLANYIRLYGIMRVFDQVTGNRVGGYIGYGKGAVPNDSNGYTFTDGIMISNSEIDVTEEVDGEDVTTTGYRRYFIATTEGVRMQSGSQSFYLLDGSGGTLGTANLITSGNFRLRVSGIELSPAMSSADNPNPSIDDVDSGITGVINFSNGWIKVHHGFVVEVYHNIQTTPPNLNADIDNRISDFDTRLTEDENNWSDVYGKTVYFDDSTDNGRFRLRIYWGDAEGWVDRITANANGVWMKFNNTYYMTCQVGLIGMYCGNRQLIIRDTNNDPEVSLIFDDDRYLSMNNSVCSFMFVKGTSNSLGTGIKMSSAGINMYAHPYQAWVSNTQGHGGDPSDRRFKKDITYDVDGDILDGLKPVRYKFKTADVERYGFIAQDVQEVVPSIVETAPEGDQLYLQYNDIIAILTAKVQKQTKTIDEQSKKIQDLEDRIARLEALLLDK